MSGSRILGLVALMFVATGCADPIEGQWTSEDEVLCVGRVEHISVFVEGDGTGYGKVCSCDFTFIWTALNDERYRFDIDFEGNCFAVDGEYDCRITKNGGLDCGQLGDFIKID
jgi:hypothetical protein